MKEKLAKLIDVKTIVTFAFVGAMIAFIATGKLDAKEMVPMVTMVVTFFFAYKATENKAQ